METCLGCVASFFGLVIDECTVALGDEKNTVNLIGGATSEVIFQFNNICLGRKITTPQRIS